MKKGTTRERKLLPYFESLGGEPGRMYLLKTKTEKRGGKTLVEVLYHLFWEKSFHMHVFWKVLTVREKYSSKLSSIFWHFGIYFYLPNFSLTIPPPITSSCSNAYPRGLAANSWANILLKNEVGKGGQISNGLCSCKYTVYLGMGVRRNLAFSPPCLVEKQLFVQQDARVARKINSP